MPSAHSVKLRPLEREDLRYVHQLDNNASVMRYWFEEPYEAFVELSDLYDKHIHDQSERRFVVECDWICPYISRHLLSLNPLLACCRRYSRGER